MKLKGNGALSENVTWPIGFALKGNVPRVNKIRGMRENEPTGVLSVMQISAQLLWPRSCLHSLAHQHPSLFIF